MSIKSRIERLSKADMAQRAARRVIVVTDDHGNRICPAGEPQDGDHVTEIHIGGISLEDV